MDELQLAVADCRDCSRLPFDDRRSKAIRTGIARKRKRRRVARTAALTAAAAAAVVVAVGALAQRPGARSARVDDSPPTHTEPRADTSERVIRLGDGSTITTTAEREAIEIVADSKARVEVVLSRGRALFEVQPAIDRLFRVRAGAITIDVFGTVFAVDHGDQSVTVVVHSGRVEVATRKGTVILTAGEHRAFPGDSGARHVPVPASIDAEVPDPAPAESSAASPSRQRSDAGVVPAVPPEPSPTWRQLARSGEALRAYELVHASGANAVGDEIDDLLLWADVTRMVGHPEEAVAPLERVIDEHPDDPRATVAALTLGRTLLRDLDRPSAAARAFRRAYDLSPHGALAEDALAHEAESWSLAGDATQARERARIYVQSYPQGRWREQMDELGGHH